MIGSRQINRCRCSLFSVRRLLSTRRAWNTAFQPNEENIVAELDVVNMKDKRLSCETSTFQLYTYQKRLPAIARVLVDHLHSGKLKLERKNAATTAIVAERLEQLALSVENGEELSKFTPNVQELHCAAVEMKDRSAQLLLEDWMRFFDQLEFISENSTYALPEATWFNALPAITIESFFYLQTLACAGSLSYDIYYPQKVDALKHCSAVADVLASKLDTAAQNGAVTSLEEPTAGLLVDLVRASLCGNRGDLSLHPNDPDSVKLSSIENAADVKLLVDDSERLVQCIESMLKQRGPLRVDFILDNAGVELLTDLALADFLLCSGIAARVYFHTKFHPTFVSDTLPGDVLRTIHWLAEGESLEWSTRLSGQLASSELRMRSHTFWNAPRLFGEMPCSLESQMAQSDLIVVKGDANYRRLVHDCNADQFSCTNYFFPRSALLALRTVKCELAVGVSGDAADAAANEDAEWMRHGKYGVIQLRDMVVDEEPHKKQ